MNILGISAFYHDSAAALVRDGDIVAAAQEERFTRKKHDAGFPQHAIDYCLREGRITPEQLDYVVFYDKPFRKFDRLFETYLGYAAFGLRSLLLEATGDYFEIDYPDPFMVKVYKIKPDKRAIIPAVTHGTWMERGGFRRLRGKKTRSIGV